MFEEQQLSQVYTLLARVARAIVATVGAQCEVVVHDLRTPESSIIAISGNLTGRTIGAPTPDPEMLPDNLTTFQDDIIREHTRTPAGRQLISSTVWVRNVDGRIVGAICINMDFSNLQRARDLLNQVLMVEATEEMSNASFGSLETFATSPEEFVAIALRGAIQKVGKAIHRLNRQDKIDIIRELELAGVFRFHRAVDVVMLELGISRASIYAYLKDIRYEMENECDEQRT